MRVLNASRRRTVSCACLTALAVVALLAAVCLGRVCIATEGYLPSGSERSGDADAASDGRPGDEPTMLVLKSGRVVTGVIRPGAGGYLVAKANGRFLVPDDQIKFEADDLDDAYHKYRRTMPSPTATNHMVLAQWCLSHKMYEHARTELREALVLEPRREQARIKLRRLELLIDPEKNFQPSEPEQPKTTAGGFVAAPVSSLAGLSRDTAQEFTARVQPILVNKCGNASCHGRAGGNDFKLTAVRTGSGSHRVFAEQNLARVLQQIDVNRPERSPLLTKPDVTHGRRGRPVFSGPAGGAQFKIIEDWVNRAAADRSRGVRRDEAFPAIPRFALDGTTNNRANQTRFERPAAATSKHFGTPLEDDRLELRNGVQTRQDADAASHPRRDEVTESLKIRSRDDFAPDDFNRRVHGTAARPEY